MINVARAVELNRVYSRRLGWQSRGDEIAEFLGFVDVCPGDAAFSEAVATWQSRQRPRLKPDGIIGPKTWKQLKAALGIYTVSPQTYAPAVPGSIPLDPALVNRNRRIERRLLDAADAYYRQEDFRWFFAYAHGQITKQINDNLRKFQRPNVLILLNAHFAEEFLRAVEGNPHIGWKVIFDACQDLETESKKDWTLMGEVELCGALMARIHISIDLRSALQEIGCIPPEDFGNMLVYVEQGSRAAINKLRGKAVGAVEEEIQKIVAPMLNLEVKVWRNAAYHSVCATPVPNPSASFTP